jgi:pimeloyl-ACP methyl ester carboxylesterase
MRSRAGLAVAVVTLVAAAVSAAPAVATTDRDDHLRVGSATLHRCGTDIGGWCGSVRRALDPARPLGPHIKIAFRWLPASRRDAGHPTLVAVEGGPGYPSIGSLVEYEGTYGPLLAERNLLLVDNRGTGRSALIDCEPLQTFTGDTSNADFATLVAGCAREIDNSHRSPTGASVNAADLFGTAYAVDHLAAVLSVLRLNRVDLYGDSYGSWFVQTFIAHHPDRLHSVILDSTYPVRGLDPWYASSGEVARRAMDTVCARDAGCASASAAQGSATERLAQLVTRLRASPITGTTKEADGTPTATTVDVRAIVDMVQDAASDPVIYRELDASVRAALAGDDAPLLRLTAQSRTWNHSPDPAGYFSNGLYMAVACTDYPQLFSMDSSPDERRAQLAAELSRAPDAFAPFTPAEWLTMSAYSEAYAACLDWPRPAHTRPVLPEPGAAEPLPASTPILIIGGDLDSLTPLSDAQVFGPTLGANVRVVPLPNTVHVTSEGDTYLAVGAECARRIIRGFVRAPARLQSLDTRCTQATPPVHTPGAYPVTLKDAAPATVVDGNSNPSATTLRAVTVATGALADATVRRWYSGANAGPGLRGGSFTATGDGPVRLELTRVRFVEDATVDGTATWDVATGAIRGALVVRRRGARPIRVNVHWTQRSRAARARAGAASLTLPAP